MSRKFDHLVERVICQMKRMTQERAKFKVLAKELEACVKERRHYEHS